MRNRPHFIGAASTLVAAVLFLVITFVPGCATFKAVGKTVSDAGAILCNLYAVDAEPAQLQGLDPAAWCEIHDNLKPFIDEALAAKQSVAMSLQAPSRGDGLPADGGSEGAPVTP